MTSSREPGTTTAPDEQADIDSALQQLIERGFQFVHPTDANGVLLAVVGVRVHDNVVDVVTLRAENDVQAERVPGDESDILAPTTVLWQVTGTAQHVLDELLALPDDRIPGGVAAANGTEPIGDVNGCWVPVDTGRMTWMRSSG
ncbi:hypothetical protein [Haloechinothrix sp. LS1_15]|uniref:hypothetical protein n=1 Tax=Haloechinothrix sp. LS1_15 TaxID=2652248 RepID=UPI002944ECDB|nr:hypothetical protein [Haloechinothrix sp. LS1_15]MDV6011218.1 hypothetical protein [Haloechinothrix sp. LS1_15]